ncbi:MAG: helicase-associated domain-containing protein [Planctomycetia bacterium]|nr:helicase-associated domain-containing protein [Planctomycetia bacterium]
MARRRQVVLDALRECPAGRRVAVDELSRFLRATGRDFEVSRSPWELYIADPEYGSLGYDDEHAWEQLQGRFVLALLFEPAATLGLLDVAYVPPQPARGDFRSRRGADDLSCLSRFDGLEYVRVNALGAWCLGLSEEYWPEPVPAAPRFRVLPNLDVVASDRPPEPAAVLLLDRAGVRASESVWRLDRGKVVAAVEGGLGIAELEDFLTVGGQGPMPHAVRVLLADLGERAGRLRDLGADRL